MTMEFDSIVPAEEQVIAGGTRYVLREASAGAAAQWRNACAKAARFADGKVVGVEGIGDTEPFLVSLCLFKLVTGPDGVPTAGPPESLAIIKTWKSSVVKKLHKWVMDYSDLKEGDEETKETLDEKVMRLKEELAALERRQENDPKNSPGATAGSSS